MKSHPQPSGHVVQEGAGRQDDVEKVTEEAAGQILSLGRFLFVFLKKDVAKADGGVADLGLSAPHFPKHLLYRLPDLAN